MKKHSTSLLQKMSAALTMLCLFLSIIIIQSCNDKKEDAKSAPKEDTAAGAAAAVPAPAAFTNGPYSVLKLEKQQLVDAFSGGAQKVLIQFTDENTAASTVKAQLYGIRVNGTKVNGPFQMVEANTTTLSVTGPVVLGNNEVTIKQIRTILGITGNINMGNAQILYFYPKKDGNNCMLYYVSTTLVGEITAQIEYPPTGTESKPSPPADPCNPCD